MVAVFNDLVSIVTRILLVFILVKFILEEGLHFVHLGQQVVGALLLGTIIVPRILLIELCRQR